MEFNIKTIKDDTHQIILDDSAIIRLHELIEGIEMFGLSRLKEMQKEVHYTFKQRIKSNTDDIQLSFILDTMNFIDQFFLFIGQDFNNLGYFSKETVKITKNM